MGDSINWGAFHASLSTKEKKKSTGEKKKKSLPKKKAGNEKENQENNNELESNGSSSLTSSGNVEESHSSSSINEEKSTIEVEEQKVAKKEEKEEEKKEEKREEKREEKVEEKKEEKEEEKKEKIEEKKELPQVKIVIESSDAKNSEEEKSSNGGSKKDEEKSESEKPKSELKEKPVPHKQTSFKGFSRSQSCSSSSNILALLPENQSLPSKQPERQMPTEDTVAQSQQSSSVATSLNLDSSPINLRNSYSGEVSPRKESTRELVNSKKVQSSKSAEPQEIAAIGWANLHMLAKKTKPTINEDLRNKKRMELMAEEDPEKKKKEEEENKKRGFIVQEMLKTERNYVTALKVLVKTFYEPMMENWSTIGLTSQDSIHKIFNKVDILFKNHQNFLKELEARVLDWNPQKKIGDLFLNETDFLLRYRHYVNNYNNAFAILTENKKTPEFKQFLAAREAQPECHHSDLQSFLLEPIQRIPRYEMLLRDLNRKTDKEHSDYKDISAALQKIEEITKWINDAKRNSENVAKVEAKLTEKVAQTLWLSNRKYIGEGKLMVVSKSPKERYVFLFNNLLLLCKETKNNEVTSLKIKEKVGIDEELILTPWKEPKDKDSAPLVSVEISRKKMMFQGATKEESLKWHKLFSDTRDHFRERDIGETLKTNKKS